MLIGLENISFGGVFVKGEIGTYMISEREAVFNLTNSFCNYGGSDC